jgi:predicted GIY-YIG superfamily endonuclease
VTAAELLSPAAAVRPAHRVECACGWVGYRLRPHGRDCPACGADAAKLQAVWLAGCAPHRGRCCYLAEIQPAYRHAQHYLGSTIDLRRRWPEHLAGGYDPATHRNKGPGSRLLAAALHAGCTVELVRVWHGEQARTLEQRLKQRRKPGSLRAGAARSLKPLCPLCNPAGWWRQYPDLPDPAPPSPRRRFVHDPALWDAEAEWDRAFPALAYEGAP